MAVVLDNFIDISKNRRTFWIISLEFSKNLNRKNGQNRRFTRNWYREVEGKKAVSFSQISIFHYWKWILWTIFFLWNAYDSYFILDHFSSFRWQHSESLRTFDLIFNRYKKEARSEMSTKETRSPVSNFFSVKSVRIGKRLRLELLIYKKILYSRIFKISSLCQEEGHKGRCNFLQAHLQLLLYTIVLLPWAILCPFLVGFSPIRSLGNIKRYYIYR